MRRWVLILAWMLSLGSAWAHVGSPNVIFQGEAAGRPVRVTIRPPEVIPGLAEITVQVEGGGVRRVTVLPLYWNAGRKGAPQPDEAIVPRGQTNLYSASLWFMRSGAYSVEVKLEADSGTTTLNVPVNAVATNTRMMSPAYGSGLAVLGLILFVGAVRISGALFGESLLAPGEAVTRGRRWRGRWAMLVTSFLLAAAAYGGKKWWDYDERDYRNNRLYRPLPVSAEVRREKAQTILELKIENRRGLWTSLLPDHGRMMHLFLVRLPDGNVLAHLHPLMRSVSRFEASLPPLPGGRYQVLADVTRENGFAETLAAEVQIPEPSPGESRAWVGKPGDVICSTVSTVRAGPDVFLAPDPDDSWHAGMEVGKPGESVGTEGGYRIAWEGAGSWQVKRPVSLRFRLDGPEGRPAPLELYLGMRGHAVVRRADGAVFSHLHPVGTFSMASQEFFQQTMSAEGASPPPPGHAGSAEPGPVSFPYEFPQAGRYRVWVQMRSGGKIFTGAFDVEVKS